MNNKGDNKKKASDFNIPFGMEEKYPELIKLILNTQSIDDEEKQYWFSIIPAMNEEKILRLKKILTDEKKEIKKLDNKYETELKRINEKVKIEDMIKKDEKNAKEIKNAKILEIKEDEKNAKNILDELDNL